MKFATDRSTSIFAILLVLLCMLCNVGRAQNSDSDSNTENSENSDGAADSGDDMSSDNKVEKDKAKSVEPGKAKGLQPFDWVLLIAYACGTLAIGVYYGRRQSSPDEYFVGSGKMNPILVGVSLFATLLSTISYLSVPGEIAGKGPTILISMAAMPIVFVVVAFWLIPVYMNQRVTSAYELLEERLGLSLRLLGATMFLALRLVWMTLLIYIAAKAMLLMMGLDGKYLLLVVAITGTISIVYTTIGGMRAVVVTDFMQTCLLFGGAVLVVASVTWDFGGFGWFPTEWQSTWDKQPVFSLDPKTRVTVVGTILSVLTWYVATMGGDQTSVQRFMATENVAAARKAVATQLTTGVIVQLMLALVGFALLAYFSRHQEALGITLGPSDEGGSAMGRNMTQLKADDLFPRYIANHLPVGVSGLVVAAMFAAAMSSVDSGVNSITAVVMTDFLDRLGIGPKTEKGHMITARVLALSVGVFVISCSSLMKYIEGNITTVTGKTVNLLTGPIFALFFFALFVPRARPKGVWIGVLCGSFVAVSIAFSGPLVYWLHTAFDIDPAIFNAEIIEKVDSASGAKWSTCEDPISFQWIGPFGLTTCIVVGYVASLLCGPAPDKKAANPKGDSK
jgi:solute:Na+ symporter, SSS family